MYLFDPWGLGEKNSFLVGPQDPLNTSMLKWGHSNYRYHQKTQNKLKIKRAFLIFQLYTLRKLNQGDVADPRAPLGNQFSFKLHISRKSKNYSVTSVMEFCGRESIGASF